MKKSVSLTLAWMFLISALSGIMLYIAPPGRIAHWGGWSLAGFDKDQWDHLHTVTTLLMLIVVVLHLYFNWRPFVSYMRSKVTQSLSLTKELLASLAVTLLIIGGALTLWPPFGSIVAVGDYVSEEWEKTLGSPPYNHAELDTVETFMKRVQIETTTAAAALKKAAIRYEHNATLLDVARRNNTTPQQLFEIMRSDAPVQKLPPREGSGMGKKSLSQVCELRGIELNGAIAALKAHGIEADADATLKSLAEKAGMNPTQLLEWIEP